MNPNRSSRTAEYNALFRALDRSGPCTPQLVDDVLARRFLSPTLAAVVTASRVPRVGYGVTAFIDRRWPGVRTSLIARTRLRVGELVSVHVIPRPHDQVIERILPPMAPPAAGARRGAGKK